MHRAAISKLRGRHYASSSGAANRPGHTTAVVGNADGPKRNTSTAVISAAGGDDDDHDHDDREMQLILSISDRLETGLNEHALQAIIELLQKGTHPDAIVAVVTSLAQRPGPV